MSGVAGAGLGLQDAAVALVVLGAVAWLTRRWWRRRRRGTCTCDGCPVAERAASADAVPAPAPGGDALVTIEGFAPDRR